MFIIHITYIYNVQNNDKKDRNGLEKNTFIWSRDTNRSASIARNVKRWVVLPDRFNCIALKNVEFKTSMISKNWCNLLNALVQCVNLFLAKYTMHAFSRHLKSHSMKAAAYFDKVLQIQIKVPAVWWGCTNNNKSILPATIFCWGCTDLTTSTCYSWGLKDSNKSTFYSILLILYT